MEEAKVFYSNGDLSAATLEVQAKMERSRAKSDPLMLEEEGLRYSYQIQFEVDSVKGQSLRFYGSIWINLKKLKFLIFYMKKLKKNSCEYGLLML